jgi:putative Mg2+ transporter-C (MgtC) family protein
MVPELQIFFQLLLASFLGGMVGLEREYGKKEAGLRTYTLVCLGSALFAIVALNGLGGFEKLASVRIDPIRIVQAIAIGIGFIGSGLIIFRKDHIEGLTTAAGLWVTSAIGIAVGLGLYSIAIFASLLSIGILSGLRILEERVLRSKL